MKTLYQTLISLIIIGLISCNKPNDNNIPPEPIDTIFTLPYLPVYPGSYWKYVDSFGDTTVILTDSVYQKDGYTAEEGQAPDTSYVPVYDSVPIWGYLAHTGEDLDAYCFTRILSDSLPVGSEWYINFYESYYHFNNWVTRRVLKVDSTITISGINYFPTIVIIEDYSFYNGSYGYHGAIRYYTKDIGLIKEDLFDHYSNPVNTRCLIDYYINR